MAVKAQASATTQPINVQVRVEVTSQLATRGRI
jgi:hypothetical protein